MAPFGDVRVTVSCPATAVLLPETRPRRWPAPRRPRSTTCGGTRAGRPGWVLVEDEGARVQVSVRDDGSGFAARAAGRGGGRRTPRRTALDRRPAARRRRERRASPRPPDRERRSSCVSPGPDVVPDAVSPAAPRGCWSWTTTRSGVTAPPGTWRRPGSRWRARPATGRRRSGSRPPSAGRRPAGPEPARPARRRGHPRPAGGHPVGPRADAVGQRRAAGRARRGHRRRPRLHPEIRARSTSSSPPCRPPRPGSRCSLPAWPAWCSASTAGWPAAAPAPTGRRRPGAARPGRARG